MPRPIYKMKIILQPHFNLGQFCSISSYCCIKFQAMVNTDLDNDLSYMQKCPKRARNSIVQVSTP